MIKCLLSEIIINNLSIYKKNKLTRPQSEKKTIYEYNNILNKSNNYLQLNPKNIIKNINIKNSPISLNNTINSFRYKQIPHLQTEKKENEYNQNHFNLTFNSNRNNNNENITKYNVDRKIKNINRKNLKKDFLSSNFSMS